MNEDPVYHALTPIEREHAEAAMEFLREHFSRSPAWPEVAQAVGVEPASLRLLFRRRFGLLPSAALTQLQVEQAKRLLEVGTPLPEIPLAVGLGKTHFYAKFRQSTGVAPGRWLRQATRSCRSD